MNAQPQLKRNLLFSGISITCILAGLIIAFIIKEKLADDGSLIGYSSLGSSFSFLVVFLLSGLITGQIGLIRGEKPSFIPILALMTNCVIFILIILQVSG